MTKIIAFSGKKQSGKNTCANFIYSLYLANQNLCQKAIVNAKGTIDIVKNNGANIELDVNKYYTQASTEILDQDVLKMIEQLNPYIKIYSFADILKKNICMDLLNLTYDQCYGTDSAKNEITDVFWDNKYLTAREVMQVVGTDIFRTMKPNIWPNATINKILQENTELAIITDCRFPNEVDAVHNANGFIIRLTRSPYNDADHISELILDKNNYDWTNFDYVIENQDLGIYDQSMMIYNIFQTIFE
jgi:hypothetical protein